MTKKILVTSALPYANGSIHIGHLIEYIQTDIIVRFLKLIGKDVIYCCADDTHGTPIEINAKKQGIKPEQLIEKYYKEHKKDFTDFLIEFDSYYTTNSAENKELAETIFNTLNEKGYIYKKKVELMYCEKCKRFLPDRYIKGECPKCGKEDQYGDICESCGQVLKTTELLNPRCVECGQEPVEKDSEHYFFKLSKFSSKLDKWLTTNKQLQPEIVNYIRNWIKEGLEDWDITRDGPYFGFNIPGEKDKYFYVWLDAPIGYISSTWNYCKQSKCSYEDYWKKDSRIIHIIGKDIIYFHFLFWPAMLMGVGYTIPENILVHGFLTVNGEKMSKSRGTFLTARDFIDRYNPEYLRYYYAGMLSKKMSDVDLDFDDFTDRVNNELVANIGNYCYRVLSFTHKYFGGKVKGVDKKAVKSFEFDKIKKAYLDYNLREALRLTMEFSSLGNKYLQDNEPWKKLKDDKESAEEVLATSVAIARNLAILIKPVLPVFSKLLEKQLGFKDLKWDDLGFEVDSFSIDKPEILVQKIEPRQVFEPNLKVAKIESVEPHPDADKLFVLQINLGSEKRQIVAGLRGKHKENDLVGRNIVVVTNLKPAKLRGVESNGMLLAAGEEAALVSAPKSKAGDQVKLKGYDTGTKQMKIEQFSKIKLKVKDKKVVVDGIALATDKEELSVEAKDGEKIR